MLPLIATQTIEQARAALQSGHGAGLPELLKLIETLTTNHAKVNLEQLSELIEKDPAVLSRVLSVANTVGHNPGFTPMASVMHAIHQLGFTRVRNLAISLMLVENAGPRNSPEQREAAAHALTAGLVAQGCAQSLGNIDPDLAFACAALRQFGNILLPVVSIDHYRAAVELRKTTSEDNAYRSLFGLTPLELSRELLRPANLPAEITDSLRDCHPETTGGQAATTFESRLLGVADFGGELAHLMLEGSRDPDVFAEESLALARRYEKIVPQAKELIEPALIHADDRISSFTQHNGAAALPTPSLQRIKERLKGKAPEIASYPAVGIAAPKGKGAHSNSHTRPAHAKTARSPSPPPAGESGQPTPDTPPLEITASVNAAPAKPGQIPTLTASIHSAANAPQAPDLAAIEAARVSDLWTSALKLVQGSFDAHECWLFLPKAGGESLPLVLGIGPHWLQFQTCAALRRDERTVFGVCLTRRENVVIHDTTAASLSPYLPEWYRQTTGAPGAFLLMPLHDKKITHGLVLIGWSKPQPITVSAAQTELARQIFASVSGSHRSKAA